MLTAKSPSGWPYINDEDVQSMMSLMNADLEALRRRPIRCFWTNHGRSTGRVRTSLTTVISARRVIESSRLRLQAVLRKSAGRCLRAVALTTSRPQIIHACYVGRAIASYVGGAIASRFAPFIGEGLGIFLFMGSPSDRRNAGETEFFAMKIIATMSLPRLAVTAHSDARSAPS